MIALDPSSPLPPFEQIRSGLAERIAAGSLPIGTRLPTVRALAAELGVSAGTVARAYRELESAGVVETRSRAGTVVRGGAEGVERDAQEAAAVFAARLRELGVPPERGLRAAAAALGLD